MNLKARTALLACAAVAALTASAAPALAVAPGPARPHAAGEDTGLTWRVVASPNGPSSLHSHLLYGVSCSSASACMAVGQDRPQSLAESWNGTAWTIVATPQLPTATDLQGVSCVSARACTAVGFQDLPARTLVETWNGAKWTVVPSPNAGSASAYNGLDSVSCVSARACTAVGGFQSSQTVSKTLIESWNGSAWSVVPSPNRPAAHPFDSLNSVYCLSARACTAVGGFQPSQTVGKTLIESWNGSVWSVVPSPNGPAGLASQLTGVSCVSATACTAVGTAGDKTLIESWNGSAWSIVPGPHTGGASPGNSLLSVSCVSARDCVAAGFFSYLLRDRFTYRTLIESWNGSAWSVVHSPNKVSGISGNFLDGVSCASASMCAAVGNYGSVGSRAHRKTLAELGTAAAMK